MLLHFTDYHLKTFLFIMRWRATATAEASPEGNSRLGDSESIMTEDESSNEKDQKPLIKANHTIAHDTYDQCYNPT